MIKSYRHKGLEKFFLTGSKTGIQPKHAIKLADHLTALSVATKPEQVRISGWNLHSLQGKLVGHWSLTANGNWRLIFKFEGEDVILVDYQDYH